MTFTPTELQMNMKSQPLTMTFTTMSGLVPGAWIQISSDPAEEKNGAGVQIFSTYNYDIDPAKS
jgi:hypothetical protein